MMRVDIRNRLGAFVIVVLSALSACASGPKVRVDKDSHTDFSQYKNFGWLEEQAVSGARANPRQNPSTLVSQRVRNAVDSALQSKGYTLLEADPDFRVSYTLDVYERPKQSGMRLGIGAGGASGNVGGGVGLSVPVGKRTEVAAHMTIDIVDAKRNAQVWTGTYETVVSNLEVTDADVDRIVSTILMKFP